MGATAAKTARVNSQRWEAWGSEVVDGSPVGQDGTQSVHQVSNGPLAHALHAIQNELPAEGTQDCGQRAHRGPGVSKVEGICGNLETVASGAVDLQGSLIARFSDANSQGPQSRHHGAGIVGGQQVGQSRGSRGQRGQKEIAVGKALRAGQANGPAQLRQRPQG